MNTSKIIKAYIGAGTYSTTEPITQGDYGYILQIEGAELPPIYRVDFSNDRHKGEALPVYGNENGAEVPKELIDTGKDIFAFYYYIGENFGKTAYTWKIPNDTRAQKGDREPTPYQQDSIDQLIVRSNEAVERAQDAQQAIEDMSVSAQTLAEGESATVTKTESEGVVHLAFGIPKGEKGDTGGMSETAIDLLEQAGNYIPFTNGGVDVWEDLIAELRGVPIVYHSVTFSGEHYTANNDATTIRNGRAYECIITPSEGYEITTLTVTMGETSIIPTESGGAYTISITSVTDAISISVTAEEIPEDLIDICLFGGQSNMDGRGTAEDATAVTTGLAYKWDNANNRTVAFEAEGSLIPAYMQEYTSQTGVPLVEVKEAIGGTGIAQYISDFLPLATNMLTRCKAYVEGQGKTVRRMFMLWNQGETDAENSMSTADYESYFATMKSALLVSGVEQIFIVNIGQYVSGRYDYTTIRTALQNVCNGTDVIMVSDKFLNATDYMDDSYHYDQVVYNTVGENAAENTVKFFSGETITLEHFDSADVYGVPAEYGTVDDWTYELVNSKVLLTAYTGSSGSVRVYHQYLIDGYYYEARLARTTNGTTYAAFTANTTITDVTIDDGVRTMNPNGYTDADNQQNLTIMFKECTALTSVTLGDTSITIIGAAKLFQNVANNVQFNFLSQLSDDLTYAFYGTRIPTLGDITARGAVGICANNSALTSVGNLNGTYTTLQAAFQNCSALESVGTFASTLLTNINSAFNGCTSLAGVVRFESSSISSATYAFNNCDLTQIEIQCPANSSTYTTISTAYPSANIVTF